MRTRRWTLVVGGLLLAILAGYLVLGDTAVRQAICLRRARRHVPALEQVLRGDPAFANVTVAPVTAGGGMLAIRGTVPVATDGQRLRAAVAATRPPVPVTYQVQVESLQTPVP